MEFTNTPAVSFHIARHWNWRVLYITFDPSGNHYTAKNDLLFWQLHLSPELYCDMV